MAAVARALPTILVAGLRTPSRRRVIAALAAARPHGERWLVAASGLPMSAGEADDGLVGETLPAGCACCTGTTPFRVGMTRLLRRHGDADFSMLLLEAAESTHLAALRTHLAGPAYADRLVVEQAIAVVDGADAAAGHAGMQAALAGLAAAADAVLVVPPTDGVDAFLAANPAAVVFPAHDACTALRALAASRSAA